MQKCEKSIKSDQTVSEFLKNLSNRESDEIKLNIKKSQQSSIIKL